MHDTEKFRLVARSLRERGSSSEQEFRNEVLSLAAYFDKLALDAEVEQEHEARLLPQCATFYPTFH